MAKRKITQVQRTRRLTDEEGAKYARIRAQIEQEKPEILARHRQRQAVLNEVQSTISGLREVRQQQGLSLSDIEERTGLDRASLSRLETGKQVNPTVATLIRYAQAVGKRIVIRLEDPVG